MYRAWNVAAYESLTLTHVENHEIRSVVNYPRLQLAERDEWDLSRRFSQHLRDGSATGHVSPQRFREMGRRIKIELLHHRNEVRPIALLQAWIVGDLVRDSTVRPSLIIVRRKNERFRR